MDMVAFIVLSLFIIYVIYIIAEWKKPTKKSMATLHQEYIAEQTAKKEKERAEREITTISIESLFENKTTDPISFEVSLLPQDFNDIEYTAFDFETANKNPLSAISLGVAHFKGNKLLAAKEFRFNNIDGGNFIFTDIHGLTKFDVKDQPYFKELWGIIKSELAGKLLVAHNAEFDTNVLKALLDNCSENLLGCNLACTYKLALRYLKDEPSYSLKSLCESYNIPYWSHKAGYDAISAGILFMNLISETPGGATTENAMRGKKFNIRRIKKQINADQ